MKLSELMAKHTPEAEFTGFVTADDWVLAVDISGSPGSAVKDYETVQSGIVKVEANLNPVTAEKQYIRSGQSTLKTGVQRVFEVSGDRRIGDTFQDWALSHAIRFGTGQAAIAPYAYFCLKTGAGERGEISVLIRSDGTGGAGDGSGFQISLRQAGSTPENYTWSAPAEPTPDE